MAEPIRRPAPASCAVGCGACCDPVILGYPASRVFDSPSPNGAFAREHWHVLLGPEEPSMVGGARVWCDAFDRHTRTCTVHGIPVEDGGQPPVCSDYPHYGAPVGDPTVSYGTGMDPACSFNAEVRPFLTIVEVR